MSTGDFASLYTSGDVILQNPIESSAIFLIVVVVCGSIEYLFTLADEVDSKFFRQMFETIAEEVLVVGVLSLMLTFGSSLIRNLPEQWSVMFDWAHICLLFMGVMFVVLLCAITLNVLSGNKRWAKFENSRISLSPESHSAREQKFRLSYEKFQVAVKAHGFCVDVHFSHYLLKAEKANLVTLGDLSWKSWLALSTIVVLNALRTKLIPQHPSPTEPNELLNSTDSLINIASYVVLAGYGTIALFLWMHFTLQLRFRQYLMLTTNKGEKEGADGAGLDEPLNKMDLDDPQSFLMWQSLNSTLSMLQAVFMFLVWYSSVFFLNMMYRSFEQNIAVALMLVCVAFAPLAIFIFTVPWTLTSVAILSSLGTSLNEEWVRELVSVSATAGDADGASPGGRRGKAEELAEAKESKEKKVVTKALRPVQIDDGALNRIAVRAGPEVL